MRSTRLALLANRVLARVGLEVRRAQQTFDEPVPLVDDPWIAWHLQQGGAEVAFHCPINLIVRGNGLGFSQEGYEPFVSTVQEYIQGCVSEYANSKLEAYYEHWQPRDAAEATLCFRRGEGSLGGLPAHVFSLHPWRAAQLPEYDEYVRAWVARDYRQHGLPGGSLAAHGYKAHGPIHPLAGTIEYKRITSVADSLSRSGYQREYGDTRVVMLRRGRELRFLQQGGFHRTAAVSALGYASIPARLSGVYSLDDLAYWPQIRDGRWTQDDALRYVDHLFEFDSAEWALSRGLR